MRKLIRLACAGVVLAALTVVPAAPAGAQSEAVAGACTMSLTVTVAPALTVVPGAHTGSVSGGGTCVDINQLIDPYSMSGSVGPAAIGLPQSCEAGELVGPTFWSFNSFGASTVNMTFTWVGAVAVAVFQKGTDFLGAAALVADPVSMANCLTSGTSSITWTGALVFEDPTLPV